MRSFSNKSPSSNCEKVIMFLRWCIIWNVQDLWSRRKWLWIWTWQVCQGTRIVFVKYTVMWRKIFLWTRYVDEVPFLVLWNSNKYIANTLLWLMTHVWRLSVNVCSRFFTTHGHTRTRIFDTEYFVPFASLCSVIGSPSWFIKCLIGKTVHIWWDVKITTKCVLSKTRACTIIECAVVRNVYHFNSTWPIIYWWYGGANASCTPR